MLNPINEINKKDNLIRKFKTLYQAPVEGTREYFFGNRMEMIRQIRNEIEINLQTEQHSHKRKRLLLRKDTAQELAPAAAQELAPAATAQELH